LFFDSNNLISNQKAIEEMEIFLIIVLYTFKGLKDIEGDLLYSIGNNQKIQECEVENEALSGIFPLEEMENLQELPRKIYLNDSIFLENHEKEIDEFFWEMNDHFISSQKKIKIHVFEESKFVFVLKIKNCYHRTKPLIIRPKSPLSYPPI
jgi:hypothetical protein